MKPPEPVDEYTLENAVADLRTMAELWANADKHHTAVKAIQKLIAAQPQTYDASNIDTAPECDQWWATDNRGVWFIVQCTPKKTMRGCLDHLTYTRVQPILPPQGKR